MKEALLRIRDETLLVRVENGQGSVSSTLRDLTVPETSKGKFENAIDGLESVVLAHACLGVDIGSKEYHDGLRLAVSDILGDYLEVPENERKGSLRQISLDVGEDRIEVTVTPDGVGTVESSFTMNDIDNKHEELDKGFLEMIAGMESVVLGHVLQGVAIEDSRYIEGLKIATEAMANNA